MSHKVILHCDMNNFYASVEILNNPALKGKAVAVCGDPDKRHGIVLAKSNIAKQAGVKTGETIWSAKQKCPDLVIVPPTFKEYVKYSKIVYNIYTEFTSEVESFGLDECWLDVTGCSSLFGNGMEIAEKIRSRIKEVTGGLTVSIGVSFTKVFAKLGSDLKKPDAITEISPENYKKIAWNLDASEMLYVGRSTKEKLNKLNIKTIGDIARASKDLLIKNFGKNGEKLWLSARGEDDDPVKSYTAKHVPDSVGNGTTTPEDVCNLWDASSVIYSLSEMVAIRLRQYNMIAEGVGIYLRDKNLHHVSKQKHIMPATGSANQIASHAIDLLKQLYDFSSMPPLRTITISAFHLSDNGDTAQLTIFDDNTHRDNKLDKTIDKLRSKYGYNVLKRGITIDTIFTCDSKEADDEFLPFDKNMNNLQENLSDADN